MMDSISDRPSIGEHEVHVWFARVPPDPGAEREAWAVLTPEERARANRLKQHRDRSLQVRTRALVRRVLATYLQVAPQDVAIAAGPEGKPEVASIDTPGWPRFNVSHSGSVALMAVSTGHEVGADVERVRADVAWRDIADKFFSPNELDAIGHVPRADQRRAFFDCWVRKEAYLKGLGVGLRRLTSDFSVPVVGASGLVEDPGLVSRRHGQAWCVYGLQIQRGWAASLAADGEVAVTIRPWTSLIGP